MRERPLARRSRLDRLWGPAWLLPVSGPRRHSIFSPSAAANRSRVESLVSLSAATSRAIADCDVPMRAATTVWESPSCSRRAASSRGSSRRRNPGLYELGEAGVALEES